MKKSRLWVRLLALGLAAALILGGCSPKAFLEEKAENVLSKVDDQDRGRDEKKEDKKDKKDDQSDGQDAETDVAVADGGETDIAPIQTMERPLLLNCIASQMKPEVTPSLPAYSVDSSLSNVVNAEQFYIKPGSEEARLLAENMFYVQDNYAKEFYESYEMNRYSKTPSFVTVDSMMHTYHLYFAYLMKKTERNYLYGMMQQVGLEMLEASKAQYETLKGTEWEQAALRNVAFFGVGITLADGYPDLPSEAMSLVQSDVNQIMDAASIGTSAITEDMLDFSQFKPRGYYEGDEALEHYFRTMMWYGQVGFKQMNEDMDRSALLINLAMTPEILKKWEAVYVVTSFFAGASDDLTYYEYRPAFESAYGTDATINDLAGNDSAWQAFHALTSKMPAPAINSIPVADDGNPDTVATDVNKGYRFMGQRFTIDEAVFQQLIYSSVGENASGNKRMLPDVLDVAAALGSDTAYEILEAQGDTGYAGYSENMAHVKEALAQAGDSIWSASLYANWLYTLSPLLQKKGEGYPSVMQTKAWETKSIEGFGGSYAELKHDTILYAKQVMAEMGGDGIPDWDDRGYVEPEVEVWARFVDLTAKTRAGLAGYGILDGDDDTNLDRLQGLAQQFLTMSEKELRGELLSEDEYELIRNYGGNLEHFWTEAYRDEGPNVTSNDFPAAIIADIATDPNGSCLEVGTGNPCTIYVVVPIDGELHITKGMVYSFYEFAQPISDRLTDTSWRQMMGVALTDSGNYDRSNVKEHPYWAEGYRIHY